VKVISASRRVDLVGGYPEVFADLLDEKAPPESVHTLVIWTKSPRNLLFHPRLSAKVKTYENLFVHLTVTGMGSSMLEKNIPPPEEVLGLLPEVIGMAGGPEHVRLRFDPIVHLRMPDGSPFSNLDRFDQVVKPAANLGIRDVTISWLDEYRKVVSRLKRKGILAQSPSEDVKRKELERLLDKAGKLGVRLHGCCERLMERSRCIDGSLLSELHPRGLRCSTKRAPGQRDLCGCTESYDIGAYRLCPHSCLYCYANPRII
jgi:DNA repair photolyase